MMTFNRQQLAAFFAATSRATLTAEDALRDLESRGITGDGTVRLATPRALCDSVAQRAGARLSGLSAPALARLLWPVA